MLVGVRQSTNATERIDGPFRYDDSREEVI